jgi:hypothetical protein
MRHELVLSVVAASVICAATIQPAAQSSEPSKIHVTSAAASLVEQGLAAAAPEGDADFQEVPAAGVRFLPNVARATNVPWIDSNGWRFARGLRKARYAKLPPGQSPLSAAEAFFFDVEAILNPDPKDTQDLGNMLRFLKAQQQAPMPPLVNIGVVDDGTPIMAEVMNLLTRRNLLYKVVPKPDPSLDLNVQLGTPDFPADAAANPYEFAARVRAKLGDDKRLVRIYGTSTVLARLTGSGGRARLSLLSFSRRRQESGGTQAMRVRLVGRYRPTRFAAYGAVEGAELGDLRHPGNTTEFWVPDFTTLAVVDLEADATQADAAAVIESAHSAHEPPMAADPNAAEWADAPRVFARVDKAGVPVAGPPTEIRSRWTTEHLYLLYICPYTELNLKPDPVTAEETPRLWNWDVAEAFIGSDDILGGVPQRGLRNRPTVDHEPFAQREQMRRGVAGRAMPGRAQPPFHHRRHRAFAVGAGDDDRAERVLRIPERGTQRRDVREAELHAEALEAEEELDAGSVRPGRRRSRHCVVGGGGAAAGCGTRRAGPSAGRPKRSARAIAALSSRRSTTRSSMPRSSRNSLR